MGLLEHSLLQFFVGSLLIHVGFSINLELVTFLEYSVTESESTKCDFAVLGQDLIMDEESESQRPLILNSHGSTDAEYVVKKSLIVHAKCLILFLSEEDYAFNDMMHLAEQFQFSKPIGVVYRVKKEWSNLSEDTKRRSWPFPIVFRHANGKSFKISLSSLYNVCFPLGDIISCPSVSDHLFVSDMDPLKYGVKRCPNGKELINDVTIPITYFGGGPYVLRKPGKQVSLGRGSYMAAIEILSKKFGFKTALTPAKSVVGYMGNVRNSFKLNFIVIV